MGTEKRERQKAGRAQRLEEARIAQQRAQRRRQFITAGVIIAIFLALFGLSAFFSNRNKNNEVATGNSSTTAPVSPSTSTPGVAPKLCIDPAKSYSATFDTTAGPIKVNLDTTRTPGTTNNFVVLSKSGYYNASPIFRADQSIDILQGGGKSSADPGPGYTIPDEGGKFTYQPGQLVMARSSGPNSGGAQWFFTAGPKSSNLDAQGTYVTFGQVTEGLDILQKMLATASQGGAMGGAPNPPVTVNKVTIDESATPPTTMAPVPPDLPPFAYGTGECTGPTTTTAPAAPSAQPGAPGSPGAATAQPTIPVASVPASVPPTAAGPSGAATGQPAAPSTTVPAAPTTTAASAPPP